MGTFSLWHWFILGLIFLPFLFLIKSNRKNSHINLVKIEPDNLELGRLWARIGGAIIDFVIVFIISAVVFFVWLLILLIADAKGLSRIDPDAAETTGIFLFIITDYFYSAILQSSAKQSTLGQRFVGVRVIKKDGAAVDFGTASVRYIVSIISTTILLKIGYLIACFTKNKQTFHDLAAETIVVKDDVKGAVRVIVSKSEISKDDVVLDEALWEQAAKELRSSLRKEGLWAKCFALANGDDSKASAEYLKIRVAQLETSDCEAKGLLDSVKKLNADQVNQLGSPAICPRCGGQIRTTTEACNHCYAWLGVATNNKSVPKI